MGSSTRPPAAFLWLAVAVMGAALAPTIASAQQNRPQPVRWSCAIDPGSARVAPGGALTAVVTAVIDDGWHVYAPDEANRGPRPVELAVVKDAVFAAAGKLDAPEPRREMDEAFGDVTASYTGTAVFRLPVSVAASAADGPHPLLIDVTYQACDGTICLPAKAVRVQATVTVAREHHSARLP